MVSRARDDRLASELNVKVVLKNKVQRWSHVLLKLFPSMMRPRKSRIEEQSKGSGHWAV